MEGPSLMKDQFFSAGFGAAIMGAVAAFVRKGGLATLRSIFKTAVVAAEQAPALAQTVAEAFTEQYEALVTSVAGLRDEVGQLNSALVEARREIDDLRAALSAAHTEIERLTNILTSK